MSDLIRRDDVIKQIEYHQNHKIINRIKTKYALEMVKSSIEELPTAEPKVGKWIPRDWTDIECPERLRRYKCSICGKGPVTIVTDGELVGGYGAEAIGARWEFKTEIFFSDYCPYCGAKMEGKANEHNIKRD